MKRGSVYLADLNPTKGSEQRGRRPVVIVSRDAINQSSPVVLIAPCTTWRKGRRLYPSQILLEPPEGGLESTSVVLCDQLRAIDKTRLEELWGNLSEKALSQLNQALLITLDLPGQLEP